MYNRVLSLILLLLVASLLVGDAAGGRRHRGRRHRRDPRVYDARPSDIEHDDADDDEEDDDDDDPDDLDDGHHRGDHRDDDDDHDHDPTYDHEAFLGREESHRYDDLTPRQSQNALLELLPKIDANSDGKVSMDELQAWMAAVAKRERRLSSDRRFDGIKLLNHALDVNLPMTFEEYKNALHQAIVGHGEGDKKAVEDFNTQLVRDQARWAKADADSDKMLTKAEFADFLRPWEAPHMKDIVIQEAMMAADKNKDGKVDLNEFMADLHPTYEADVKDKKKLPKWVEKEEKKFKEKLDTNKDGVLDPSEIFKWIVPDDFDHSRRETRHLFKLADKDNDKHLTREEILDKWKVFVGHRPDRGDTKDDSRYSHEEL